MGGTSQSVEECPPGPVPELLITDLTKSLDFWGGLCEFTVAYDRPDEGFASLRLPAIGVLARERTTSAETDES